MTERTKEDLLVELVHLRDDYEKLRGTLYSLCKRSISLLDDGLHAEFRAVPKTNVLIDHTDRVLVAMRGQLAKMDSETNRQ
jgi:hypothetical protein